MRGGEHDDRQPRPVLADLGDRTEPVEAGHLDVEHDDVGLELGHPLERLEPVPRLPGHLDVARLGEGGGDQPADDGGVVDDEHTDHALLIGAAGTVLSGPGNVRRPLRNAAPGPMGRAWCPPSTRSPRSRTWCAARRGWSTRPARSTWSRPGCDRSPTPRAARSPTTSAGSPRDPAERRKAVDALTINETSWFRDQAPYRAFTDVLLPALLEERAERRHLRIWSAACSSGQEAYSIAMLLDQHLPPGWTSEIVASDVSTRMLERVREGRYSQVEMNRGLPASHLVRYFTRAGNQWQVVPRLRAMVTVRHQNLAAPFLGLGAFDVVLLRNVLIYFDQATRHDVLRRMRPAVAPGGYLLLGSTETTVDLPPDLEAAWRREQVGRVQVHRPAATARGVRRHPAPTPTGA
ncbi:CheR family methyltransferase [Nocardioides sp. TF02-7]|uniref:CheR family methyltransferase n=1 Tax=Nocardioides sp. TF02-7 TaxID=2917724 RepID=UPI001F05B94D|nr:CheR family methyltransferase [Nocardioides sp. TF02-7]UMG92953.1 hypothetical protein MF408_00855 [Nocardioides sp. TF02-7]